MIEFIERHMADGSMTARVKSDQLPAEMRYIITQWPDGKITGRSQAYGNGSVRYYTHRTYDAALAHAYAWASRKIAENRGRSNSEIIDAVVQSIAQQLKLNKETTA